MINRRIYLFILLVIFTIQISYAEVEDEWVITKKFSVTDFDEEGNNLYIDDRGLFYVDKIDMANNELIIKRFNKEKALVDIIRTRIFYEKTSSNTYLRRNEMLAFFLMIRAYIYTIREGNIPGRLMICGRLIQCPRSKLR